MDIGRRAGSRLRLFHESITSWQRAGGRSTATLYVGGGLRRKREHAVRGRTGDQAGRGLGPGHRARADVIGAGVRAAGGDGPSGRRGRYARRAVRRRVGWRAARRRPLGRRVREQAARQAGDGDARPSLHPHPSGLRLPLSAAALARRDADRPHVRLRGPRDGLRDSGYPPIGRYPGRGTGAFTRCSHHGTRGLRDFAQHHRPAGGRKPVSRHQVIQPEETQ
jgi:hypothetical protein